jgi:hypothetical protein
MDAVEMLTRLQFFCAGTTIPDVACLLTLTLLPPYLQVPSSLHRAYLTYHTGIDLMKWAIYVGLPTWKALVVFVFTVAFKPSLK